MKNLGKLALAIILSPVLLPAAALLLVILAAYHAKMEVFRDYEE